MEMTSRYAGKCADCQQRFPAGTVIDYTRNARRGQKARHVDCRAPATTYSASSSECTVCDGEGELYGGQMCAYCDGTGAGSVQQFAAHGRSGSTVTQFSSGAVVFQNRAGRCIDAPCCGCCS